MSWLNHKPDLPAFSKANPGRGTSVRVRFSGAQRSWDECLDVLTMLSAVLESHHLKFQRGQDLLEFENGLIARPQFVRLQALDNGYVTTSTTIELNHPTLCPAGTFEFQHAIETSVADSLREGFNGWVETDLPVFLDALRDRAETCMTGIMEVAHDTSPARKRQVLFGPTFQCVTNDECDTPEVPAAGDVHEFCPCCLLTNCLDAFQQHIEGDEFCGIRLYAARDEEGVPQADCRINGVNWPPGALALRKYVGTWADRGFEYRKQYVAIRTLPEAIPAASRKSL